MCSSVTLCHPERERGAWGSEGAITHRPCPQVPRWARDDIHCYAGCRMDLHLTLGTRYSVLSTSSKLHNNLKLPFLHRLYGESRAFLNDAHLFQTARALQRFERNNVCKLL